MEKIQGNGKVNKLVSTSIGQLSSGKVEVSCKRDFKFSESSVSQQIINYKKIT